MVTNYPVEAPGPLSNPLMGFRGGSGPYPTLHHQYIGWNQIENDESDTVQKIRDFCNAQWKNLPTNNVKVIPRVYLDWDWNMGNESWPADLQTTNWTSQQFKDRVVRLIGRLGEVWDNDPRVAWVQTGIIGYWGEQESPVGISQDGWAQRLGDAFTGAFPNKKFIVRNMGDWPGYNVGVYWDSFGHPGQRPWAWTDIQNFNNQGRYLTQVVEGETAYNWGVGGQFKDLYGGVWVTNASNTNGTWESSPEITLNNAQYTDNMIDVIRELHCSALGWISGYELDGRYGTDPNSIRANAARMQKEFGYRFHLTEFACSARTEPGANLDVGFKVKNQGSAPFYENWPLAVVLINEASRQIVWKATLPNVDIRTWQPGHNYSYTNRAYQTPAQEHQIAASVPVPAGLSPGQYLVGLSILEPLSRTPGVFFAVTNFFMQSQSQPLMRIGIGTNASSHTLTGVVFNDLVTDDKRYYTLTVQGPTHTLIGLPSANGSISLRPGNGSYVQDTGVEVTAKPNLGYAFSSWGGALAGLTNNPAIVVMDTSKTISANYVAAPIYTLSTSASNGSITLNPLGGIYNAGAVVTLTPKPSWGYGFGFWSGDLAGSTNPMTITMNGNRSVTANFTVLSANTNILFVVGASLNASDLAIRNRLQNFGYSVQVVADSSATTADASGKALILISSTVISGNVNTKFTSVAVPVINWEQYLEDDLGFTGNTDAERFTVGSQTTLNITNAAHPLAAGLSAGVWTVATGGTTFSWGEPGGSPIIIARLTDGSSHPCIYAYEAGAGMLVGTAPARRVNLFLNNDTFAALNADGVKLFDAAVNWATSVTPPPTPPITYTLTTSAPNGSITLNPPGGIYTTGTVVTVTANPNYGYALSNWSGDLGGSVNPTNITMNGNQSVTANLSLLPLFTLVTSAVNGFISLNPSGGLYPTGTVVTVTAIPNTGYGFGNWSGDLSGSVNPRTLTMNGNQGVIANFTNGPTSFRVNCGGAAYTAAGGVVFAADGTHNIGGSSYSTGSAIAGTTDDPLYQSERWGTSFGYSIPLAVGVYEVKLMFAEIYYNSAGSRVFNVAMEGTQVITNLDIWTKVGMNAAYNVTNRVTVSDGQLNIAFSRVADNAKISAIQVQRIAGTSAPVVTVSPGTTNFNATLPVGLQVNEDFGYYSRNGGAYMAFTTGGTNLLFTNTTTLAVYGRDAVGNVSATNTYTYTLNLPPSSPPTITGVTLSPDGSFSFSVTNASGNYRVQTHTNLVSPAGWISISTNTAPFTFTVTNVPGGGPQRFYRVVTP